MSITDTTFDFSTNQAITTASVRSTREKDLGPTGGNLGSGTPVFMVYRVTEAFTVATGTPSLVVHNVLDVAPGQTGLGTATFVGSSVSYSVSNVVGATDLFVGQEIYVPVAPLTEAQRRLAIAFTLPWRYFGAYYQIATSGTFATGKLSCHLTAIPPQPVKLTKFSDGITSDR